MSPGVAARKTPTADHWSLCLGALAMIGRQKRLLVQLQLFGGFVVNLADDGAGEITVEFGV